MSELNQTMRERALSADNELLYAKIDKLNTELESWNYAYKCLDDERMRLHRVIARELSENDPLLIEKSAYDILQAELERMKGEAEKHRWRLVGAQVDPTPEAYRKLELLAEPQVQMVEKSVYEALQAENGRLTAELQRAKEELKEVNELTGGN